MSNFNNKETSKNVYISHENIYNFQNDFFYLDDLPKINKSTFELKHYYKSKNNIIDIMKEEKFNMINEIKQINESIHEPRKNIEEDLKSNSSIESLCPKDTNIYLKPYDWSTYSKEMNFKKIILSIMTNEEIVNFKKNLEKLNLTGPECDEKILFSNIGSLNKYEDENEKGSPTLNSNSNNNKKGEKYLMWRKIKGDGNCYYRSVIFALIENIILTKDINYLKNIITNFIEKSNNKILKIMFSGLNLDINFVKKCFIIIYLSITSKSHDPVSKAYIVFYKMINNYKDFDYGLILFFKFILYEYIEQNKQSTYSFKFQVLIGNLLPNDCQNDDGVFNYSHFYKNYLMKFYQYAEKIIIYLTPFIFGKEIIIKYINENEGKDADIQQFEFGKNLSFVDFDKNNQIELLYKKTHYDLLYNNNYYNLYKDIFKITLFKYIYSYQVNICQICSENNDKNSILIKLESDIHKANKNEIINSYNNKVIICHKCLFKEIKQNILLLYTFFIKKIKKYFLDTFSEQIYDFLPKKFIFSNKLLEVTYSHAINALSQYRPKYNFEYFINQIKNEICICCNANINENKNKNFKPIIILPCKCILCSNNCVKEFYYILMSGAYIKEEFICFCNKKYDLEKCLLMIEKYNEKKFNCKEMIEFLFLKQNKNKCFLCLKENVNNKMCYVIEPKFYLNHIIKHFICNECYDKDENFLGQNIECNLCKRNHIIDKFSESKNDINVKGYNLENEIQINKENNKDNLHKNYNIKKEVKDINNNIIDIKDKDSNKNDNRINFNNNNINKNINQNIKIRDRGNKKIEDFNDDEEEEKVTVIKIKKRKKK